MKENAMRFMASRLVSPRGIGTDGTTRIQRSGCRSCHALALALIALSFVVSGLRAADEPLQLIVHAPSELGDWRFLQGAPIDLTVSIVNVAARAAEEEATQRWLDEVREAERVDGPAPARQSFTLPSEAWLSLGPDNATWYETVSIRVEQLTPTPRSVLTDLAWENVRTMPTERREGELRLGLDPVWTTLSIPPEVTSTLEPGRYRFTASRPGSVGGQLEIVIQLPRNNHQRGLLHHEQALHALRTGDPDQAIELAELAITELEIDPKVASLTLGQALAVKGALEDAVEAIEAFLIAYEAEERWEEFPQAIRNYVEDLKAQIQEGR